MTLKRMKLLANIPTSSTLKEAGDKAGYKTNGGSRQIYRESTRKHIAEAIGYDPKAIINAYEDFIARCKADDDKTNERLAYDSLARINAMFKDTHDINVRKELSPSNITPEMLERARQYALKKDVDIPKLT